MMLDADGLVGPWQYGKDGQVGAKLMRWPKKPQLVISMRLRFLGRSTLTEVRGFLRLKLLTLCRAPRMHREQILIFLIVFSTSHL